MTQPSVADDRGDDAAEDAAAHVIHEGRQGLLSGGKADPARASRMDPVLTGRPSLCPKDATPMWMRTDLTRLESAFPAFSFTICRGRRGPSFEAWRRSTPSGLCAIITDDLDELWDELGTAPR